MIGSCIEYLNQYSYNIENIWWCDKSSILDFCSATSHYLNRSGPMLAYCLWRHWRHILLDNLPVNHCTALFVPANECENFICKLFFFISASICQDVYVWCKPDRPFDTLRVPVMVALLLDWTYEGWHRPQQCREYQRRHHTIALFIHHPIQQSTHIQCSVNHSSATECRNILPAFSNTNSYPPNKNETWWTCLAQLLLMDQHLRHM